MKSLLADAYVGETGSVQPLRLIQEPPVVPSPEAIPVHEDQVEMCPRPTNAIDSQNGNVYCEDRIPIDDILGKQGSLVRESSAIKAYSGNLCNSKYDLALPEFAVIRRKAVALTTCSHT